MDLLSPNDEGESIKWDLPFIDELAWSSMDYDPYVFLRYTDNPTAINQAIRSDDILAQRFVARNIGLSEEQIVELYPYIKDMVDRLFLFYLPACPLSILEQASMVEDTHWGLKAIGEHPNSTPEVRVILALRALDIGRMASFTLADVEE